MNGFITIGKLRLEKKTLLIGMIGAAVLAGLPIIGDYIDGMFTSIRSKVKSITSGLNASATAAANKGK